MKQFIFMTFSLLFFCGCTNDVSVLDNVEQTECSTEDSIKEKDLAKTLILGKWNWINTTYSSRGAGVTIVTPESTNKIMRFEFTQDKLKIFTNNDLTNELDYTIQFWGEGSSNVDEVLVVKYDVGGRSMLFLNTSCLRLVNSYNDVGGDLTFKRED